jgi:hypothetical protein
MSNSVSRSREALNILGDTGDLVRIAGVADLHAASDDPQQWIVWCLDSDGAMLETVFSGPSALERATEYSRAKYSGLRHCEPRLPQYR